MLDKISEIANRIAAAGCLGTLTAFSEAVKPIIPFISLIIAILAFLTGFIFKFRDDRRKQEIHDITIKQLEEKESKNEG